MKLKNLLLVVFSVIGSLASNAQSNLLNAKTPDEIGKKTAAQLESDNDKPLPYGYVHDRDVLMGKTTWEIIDLDERVNFPLYFPVDTAFVGKERRSLFQVLLNGIKEGKITEVYGDDYFNSKKTISDIQSVFKFRDTTDAGKDEFNNFYDDYKSGKKVLSAEYINETELSAADVSGYKIKGFWYFDKRQSELKYRLLAICPIATEARDKAKGNTDTIELFWVYFPAIRDVLHEAKAFNDKNSAMPITFDHLLNSRRFSGVIYKEENVYGDRTIQDYMKDNSQLQLLESERVKEKIRNFEQDMWNY
ncbi:gliding motility protein GldN [Flavobacterium aquatile]|uniref:Gliding motility protein GldO n=1 Tax=Flavobacterium aquatile LMG 4008 = ATCC 11947 TaxID=1453498 RepID=A0A095U012_9FLAO|nr:gliding motility protein GldN [Flavobacterium aquatile]KGD67968.1 gliding motility protein GldO [Flavobacterium aquatile LMG 4008 = ATCC 11947]OXA65356.1 gliding motility protein GldN [Flavobacterium aquatile LMG 4008 = ATCC 11947]GEC78916.1 gliding motility protein GldO [Flavobacterium aquatile]